VWEVPPDFDETQSGRYGVTEVTWRQGDKVKKEHRRYFHRVTSSPCHLHVATGGENDSMSMTIDEILERASDLHRAGRIAEAEPLYRQILSVDPRHQMALHRLGILALQAGKPEAACSFLEASISGRPDMAASWCVLGQARSALGKFKPAIVAFHKSIQLQPTLSDAHFGLGLAHQSLGSRDEAAEAYEQTIHLQPNHVEAWNNLGNLHFNGGRLAEAERAYRRAIELSPGNVGAYSNLGSLLQAQGRLPEALEAFERAKQINPEMPVVYANLGNALCTLARYDEATAALEKALELKPDFAQAAYNLGNVYTARRDYAEAVRFFRRAVEIQPNYVEAHNNLGNALQGLGEYKAAAEAYLEALKIRPDYYNAHNNLGSALRTMGRTGDAVAAFEQTIKLQPDFAPAYCNLGNALKDAGDLDGALAQYRKAMEYAPRDTVPHSNLVYSMQYHPDCTSVEILREALRWNVLHAAALRSENQPHRNVPDPNRRLRIGYVGADFRNHCQSNFTLPLFSNHDRANFEIYCFTNQARVDDITEKTRSAVDHFFSLSGLPDARAADLIREQQIDILVDLTMHMAHGRNLVFARKPAPVQIAWLAYPGTTGLAAMDYRLSDPHLDPPGDSDLAYSEQTIRLPDTFWCYAPLETGISTGPLPAITTGYVQFACLNNFCKVNLPTLERWAPILSAVPNSRLLLLAGQGKHRDRVRNFFESKNIAPNRVDFVEFQNRQVYLELYQKIDVGLDTLPYNGHTTSLDSFWMGVPVVTRVGQMVVGRAGLSQLQNLGLPELAGRDDAEFIQIAVTLAKDTARLADLRASLRARMENSPLMDAARFAKNIEAVYRDVWTKWCLQG
jgi:protein O-GlcNAc transferase